MIRARHIPNIITVLRILLVGPIVWALLAERYSVAIGLFLIAGASDALDGFLAKQFDWSSRLGGILDALADKLLLISTFLALWWLGMFPGWFVFLILARDVLIVGGGIAYRTRVGMFDPAPTPISKLNTFLQILLAAGGVLHLGLMPLPDWVFQLLIWSVVATVLLSGAGYVVEWSRRAANGGRSG